MIMRKLSSHPRAAKSYMMPKGMEGRRYSLVEELQQHAYDTDSNADLGTPNSQNMTDTDPPSKPSITVIKPPVGHGNIVMEGIPEDAELDRGGDDDDFSRWNNYVSSREVSEGLLNEITGMKSDVRREIEVMGGKMHQLEQNISTILRLLQKKGLNSSESEFVSPLGSLQPTTMTPEAPRSPSGTASIISRVKAEMPEDVLPDWVEMENYGMATDAKDNNETAKPEEEEEEKRGEEEEKRGEEEVKPKRTGGRIAKKRQLEAKRRKKKAGKTASKHDSDEEHEAPEVHHDDLLDAPEQEATAEQVSSEKAEDENTMPLSNEPKVKKQKPKQKKKKGEKSQVALEMNDIPHQSEPEIQKNETQDDKPVKPDNDSLKSDNDSLKAADNPGTPSSSSQQEEAQESQKKWKKKKAEKKSKGGGKKDAESDGAPQVVTESPEKVPEKEDEPESKEEGAKLDDDGDSKQSQPAQPEETEHPEIERSISPVADSQKPLSRVSTARKSSARSQKRQDNSPQKNTPSTEETSANEETSPEPEQENKPSSRAVSPRPDEQCFVTPGETTPGRQSRQSNDVALTIEDSDDDEIMLLKKDKPKYVA